MSQNQQAAEAASVAIEPDEAPDVQAAAEAVRRATEELERACESYKALRQEAACRIRKLRESRVEEVIESSLEMVRCHPAVGVGLAAAVGFFLGRLFRR
ncbi:MAG: hypothetical protein ACYC6Y_20240 [Thermoguttaceae bacterium]